MNKNKFKTLAKALEKVGIQIDYQVAELYNYQKHD